MPTPLEICTVMPVPQDLLEAAALHALEVNPKNAPPVDAAAPPSPLEAAMNTMRRWDKGSTLRVCFLDADADPAVCRRIKTIAHEWSQYANIRFQFVEPSYAEISEIRISFNPFTGSWSRIGTDATLPELVGEPSMNYGWLTAETEDSIYRRVVLHEFGHALGLIHEHLSPDSPIPWNEEAVIDYYRDNLGWNEKKTRMNVLIRMPVDEFTRFDPKSIMLYPVPEELTIGDFAIPWRNSELSEQDKQFIGKMYPFEKFR